MPRWILKNIKENGHLVRANTKDRTADKVQDDWIADIVCGKCEDLFTIDDTFADRFFKYKRYRLEDFVVTEGDQTITVERHKHESKKLLLHFAASLIIRTYLFQAKTGDQKLKPFFEHVREGYLQRNLDCPFEIFKLTAVLKFVALPYVAQDMKSTVEMYIFGNRITVYFNEMPAEFLSSSSVEELIVVRIEGTQNKFYQELSKFARGVPVNKKYKR